MAIATERVVELDFQKPKQLSTIRFLQYDTNVIKFIVEDNGAAADLSNITSIVVNLRRPDKKVISQVLTADGNEITYRLTNSEMLKVGECEVALQLYDDEERVTIAKFKIVIDDNIENGDAPTVEDISLVQSLIESVNERLVELVEYDNQLTDVQNGLASKVSAQEVEGMLEGVTELIEDTKHQIRKDVYGDFKQKSATLNIIAGLDSLTAGTGSGAEYTKWLTYFKEQMYTVYGYGGPGYVPFSNDTAVFDSDILSLGLNGMVQIEGITNASDFKILNSLDNKGVFNSNADNGSLDAEIKTKWTNGKIFYLIQPGGGTFNVGYLNDASTTQIVDTNGSAYSIGVLELPKNDLSRAGKLAFRAISGNVVIFGGMFTNDEGVTISRIGKGGDDLALHASKNETTFNAFLDAISPDVLLLNAGTNDTLSNSEYVTTYSNYANLYKNKNCRVIAVLPHSMLQQPTWKYASQLKTICANEKFSLLDMTYVLGDSYEDALSKGNIKEDGIHQTDNGNKLYANKILTYLNIPLVAKNVNKTFTTDSNTSIIYSGELTSKTIPSISNWTETQIYDLGLVAGYCIGFFELTIIGTRNSTNNITVKNVKFKLNSATTNNQVDVVGALTITDVYHDVPGDSAKLEYTITCEKVDNRAIISITPTTHDMQVSVVGKYQIANPPLAAKVVFEN